MDETRIGSQPAVHLYQRNDPQQVGSIESRIPTSPYQKYKDSSDGEYGFESKLQIQPEIVALLAKGIFEFNKGIDEAEEAAQHSYSV